MYDYTPHLIAPRCVEFIVPANQGMRVVRVIIDNPSNPRIMAYNEKKGIRSPAMLFTSELESLLDEAYKLIFNVEKGFYNNAD